MNKIICIAAVVLSACATQHPSENLTAADYNVQLGLGYLAQEDRVRAKDKLLHAVTLAPHALQPYLALAYYYETINNPIQAQQTYQQALQLNPDAGQVNNNYGAFLCTQGDYQQALTYLERAMADPYYKQTASAYENAALCSAKMRDYKAAAHYAALTLQQDPQRTHVLLKLNVLLEQQGQTEQAVDYLNRYQQTNS